MITEVIEYLVVLNKPPSLTIAGPGAETEAMSLTSQPSAYSRHSCFTSSIALVEVKAQ
jgi:hypothetical protein